MVEPAPKGDSTTRRRVLRGALLGSGAVAGTALVGGQAQAQTVDATAIHQTGDETKTGELTLVPSAPNARALVLKAAAGQSANLQEVQRSDGDVAAAWGKTGNLMVFGTDGSNPRPFEFWVRRNGVLNPTGPSVYINYGGHLRMLSSLVVSGRTVASNADPVVLPSQASYMLGVWSDVTPGSPVMVVRPNSDLSPVFWGLDTWGYRRMQIDANGTLRWAPAGTGNSQSQAGVVANNVATDASLGRETVNGAPALSLTGAPLAITPASPTSKSLIIQTLTGQTADVINVLDPTQGNLFRVSRAGGVYTVANPSRVSGVFQSTNASGVYVGSESNNRFSIITDNKFRSRWENNGNIGLNGNMASYGGGVGVIAIANAVTPPTADPSGGFVLYGTGGYLAIRSPNGDVFDTTKQPAIASPTLDAASLKAAIDSIRSVLQKLGATS